MKYLITSVLGTKEYCRVSNYRTAKDIWNTLKMIYEDTIGIKKARTNTLDQEFELARKNSGTIHLISSRETSFLSMIKN